jgi:hypothetical protein
VSRWKDGDRVRLIQPGFAETGRVGVVVFEGSASASVDFPIYGVSQLLDEWLIADDGTGDHPVTDMRMSKEDQALEQAEREGFLRVSRAGTKTERHWWNRCEYLDQPFMVLIGKPGGNATIKVDVAPKRSIRQWTADSVRTIKTLVITLYTDAYGGDQWHGGKYYIGPQVLHAYKLPYDAAEHLATVLHEVMRERDMYEAHPLPSNVVPFRKGA